MKSPLVVIGVLLLNLGALAQTEVPLDSKITNVTVFLSKAQVTRQAKARLEAGKTTLVLTGLTAYLDTESIQASGKGNFVILGISHRQNFLTEQNVPKALKVMRDSMQYYQRELILDQSQNETLAKEEQLLNSNQRIGGNNQNITVAELKAMADFYRARLTDIAASKVKVDEKISKLNDRIVRLTQQINDLHQSYERNTGEIVVSVSADAATEASLEVSYVIENAGWTPVYDLRAINTKSPITFSYKASVAQETGEDWKNVKLKLSTANPNQSGLKPELYTWILDFYEPSYGLEGKAAGIMRGGRKKDADRANEVVFEEPVEQPAPEAASIADYTSTIQTTLNTEFDISLPYTISSTSKPTVVDIRNYEMNATYEYSVAPKLDTEAFLLARGLGWEEFNLLPGEANIFFEGTFVGKSFIDPNNIKDTLSVSLGRDKRIVVKRDKLKDLTSRKMIGGNQRENYAWEISVRNTKNEPVKIVVEDQLPVSQNTQIEVIPGDLGGAKHDVNTGKLTWVFNFQPNETKKVSYKFEVKYPKDKKISGL